MSKHAVRGVALGLGFLAVLGASAAEAKDVVGWKVVGAGSTVTEGASYSLYNLDQKAYSVHDDRTGLNWGWSSQAKGNIVFRRKAGGGGPLKCGETFALYDGKEFLMKDSQNCGIGLSTRTKVNDAYYQWKFACAAGQSVPTNQPLTLVNTVANDSVVGAKRACGVNLCWGGDAQAVGGKNYCKAGF